MVLLLDRYQKIKSDMASAYQTFSCLPYPHRRAAPELMVVTKNQTLENIIPLLDAGHRLFGENRVQEAQEKWPTLKARYSGVRLHLIGPLQRNKVSQALGLFEGIETIDRLSLLKEIVLHFQKIPSLSYPTFLIQVNVGNEPQKAGISKNDLNSLYEGFLEAKIPLKGLMCIPPYGVDANPYFDYLRHTADEYSLPLLSMGMSEDFICAIRWRTSWVRIGTALFGSH